MTIAEWISQNISKYPDKKALLNECCKAMHCQKDTARRNYNKAITHKTIPPTIGLSEKDIRAKHDNMYKIREGVKKLQKGIFLTDQQMRDFCKVSPNIWRGYCDHSDFEKYKYKPTAKDTYWATPDTIRKVVDINAY